MLLQFHFPLVFPLMFGGGYWLLTSLLLVPKVLMVTLLVVGKCWVLDACFAWIALSWKLKFCACWPRWLEALVGWVVVELRWSLALTRLTTNSSRHNNPNMTRKINEEANFFVFSFLRFCCPWFLWPLRTRFCKWETEKSLLFYNLFLEKEGQKTFG